MKRMVNMLKRAGKACFKAYADSNTVKLSNGKTAYVSMTGYVFIA